MADTDSMIDSPDRLPKPSDFVGQPLFRRGDGWQHNATLNWMGFPWDTYVLGYKEAADALAQALVERKISLDTAVYPMVFLYRQAIELKLKQLVQYTRQHNGKSPLTELNHRLMPLWSELREFLEEFDKPNEDLAASEDILRQLTVADPNSFAFRYPESLKGEANLPDPKHIDIVHFANVIDSVFVMLSGYHDWIYETYSQRP